MRTTLTLASTVVTLIPVDIIQVTEFEIYSFKLIPLPVWAFQPSNSYMTFVGFSWGMFGLRVNRLLVALLLQSQAATPLSP